jgi:hydroxymethylpyrimidine/phosphomethylpyrimidine kinase
MLATSDLVSTVATAIREHELDHYVLDPVMVATSGDPLLEEDAVTTIIEELLPLADLVTPNVQEAAILADMEIETPEHMVEAGREILSLGAAAVLVKGGHLESEIVDILLGAGEEQRWNRARIDTRHTHGTGCTLSAAITAGLALGHSLPEAVDRGIRFTGRAIAGAPGLGSGRGPVDHFADTE